MSGSWIRPGLRYHQQGPGHNIRWDRSRLAALAIVYKEKEMANTGIEKDSPKPKKSTPKPKKEVRIAFAFCFCACFLLLLLLYTFCSARDWDGKDYLRIIPRVVW